MQQNKILEGKIQRSPSRVAKTKRPDASSLSLATSTVAPSAASTSALPPSTLSNAIFPGSYNSSGPQIFLRIRIQDTVDAAHLYTTISVYVLTFFLPNDDDGTTDDNKQLGDDVYARGTGDGVQATETAGKGVRAAALGHEHPHPARPHRRESAGRIGPQAREALDVASHECGRETDWAVDRPERCATRLASFLDLPP